MAEAMVSNPAEISFFPLLFSFVVLEYSPISHINASTINETFHKIPHEGNLNAL